jgi:hypothetical protein
MATEKKKPDASEDIKAVEIKLERIPVENLAEVTQTLDRVRAAAQKLVGKIAEAAEKYPEATDELTDGEKLTQSDVARHHLEIVSNEVGKGTQHARPGDENRSKRRHDEREIKLRKVRWRSSEIKTEFIFV